MSTNDPTLLQSFGSVYICVLSRAPCVESIHNFYICQEHGTASTQCLVSSMPCPIDVAVYPTGQCICDFVPHELHSTAVNNVP